MNRLLIVLSVIVVAVVVAGCHGQGGMLPFLTATPQPQAGSVQSYPPQVYPPPQGPTHVVIPGQVFALVMGETAVVGDGNLWVKFARVVPSIQRCPPGALCPQSVGRLQIVLDVSTADQRQQSLELGLLQPAQVAGYGIRMLAVDPYPQASIRPFLPMPVGPGQPAPANPDSSATGEAATQVPGNPIEPMPVDPAMPVPGPVRVMGYVAVLEITR